MTAPALELRGVRAAYGPFRALFDVSFEVPAGGVVALLGPNGAGKATVARVASGLVPAAAGQVLVGGRDVTGWPAFRIARAGLTHVPEGRAVFARLSVEEHLTLALRRRTGRAGVAAGLAAVYGRFDVLAVRRHQRAGTLSGGQQRLLSLATALALAPSVAVVDELSLGLAPSVVDDVYRALADLHAAGTALLVVEQQVDRALAAADRAVVLERGAVVYDGPTAAAGPAVEGLLRVRAPAGAGRPGPAAPR